MRFLALILSVFVLPSAALPSAQTATARQGKILIVNAWSRPTPPGVPVGVVYFTISNTGSKADRLMSLSSPIASAVEIHESHAANGVMEMRAVESLECPAGASLQIEPGGYHIMLLGLTRALLAGSTFELSLHFRDAGVLAVQVPVENRQ